MFGQKVHSGKITITVLHFMSQKLGIIIVESVFQHFSQSIIFIFVLIFNFREYFRLAKARRLASIL